MKKQTTQLKSVKKNDELVKSGNVTYADIESVFTDEKGNVIKPIVEISLTAIMSGDLSGKMALGLVAVVRKIRDANIDFAAARKVLLDSASKKDEDGKPIIIGDKYQFETITDETNFTVQFNDLLNTELPNLTGLINALDFENVKGVPGLAMHIIGLGKFVKHDTTA